MREREGGGRGGGRTHLFPAFVILAIDHASLLRLSILATPYIDTSNVWAFVMFLPYSS